MPHLRSKDARLRREKKHVERYGHPSIPLKRYPAFYQRKKFSAVEFKSHVGLDPQLKDTLRMAHRECKICGWNVYPEALIIHHVDKNRNNNDISNLVVLCRNCHYLLHRGLLELPREK